MRNLPGEHADRPRAFDVEGGNAADRGAGFTPAEFFRDAGTLIAGCLGLGLLMQMLLG